MECSRRAGRELWKLGEKEVFQSLFLWNALVEGPFLVWALSIFFVSILVFMECSRRVYAVNVCVGSVLCFNPCFYGMLS